MRSIALGFTLAIGSSHFHFRKPYGLFCEGLTDSLGESVDSFGKVLQVLGRLLRLFTGNDTTMLFKSCSDLVDTP